MAKKRKHGNLMKRNAAWLIEASEKIKSYDTQTLDDMKTAYAQQDYDDVVDLAYLHDRENRPKKPAPKIHKNHIDEETGEELEFFDPSKPLSSISGKKISDTMLLSYCVKAMSCLEQDLTYENKAKAKNEIKKIMNFLRERLQIDGEQTEQTSSS